MPKGYIIPNSVMVMGKPRMVINSHCELGEGVIWLSDRNTVMWVDIEGKRIYAYHTENDQLEHWEVPERIGFIQLAEDGNFIAGLESGVYFFTLEDEFYILSKISSKFVQKSGYRFNDGACDMHGRLWAGTMDMNEKYSAAAFYQVVKLEMNEILIDFTITNGPAFDKSGKVGYFNETQGNDIHPKGIYRAGFDAGGALLGLASFVDFSLYPESPDGMAVDTLGNLYVAIWGGWAVNIYNTEGSLLEVIKLPVSQVTKVAFGGPDLSTLYISSARIGLTKEQLEEQPLAGSLFAVEMTNRGFDIPKMKL